MTARWGTPAALSASVANNRLELAGRVVLPGTPTVWDEWNKISLPLTDAGTLDPDASVVLMGWHTERSDDEEQVIPITGTGTLRMDESSPELRVETPTPLLAWSSINIRAAEPLAATELLPFLQVEAASGAVPFAFSASPSSDSGSQWVGSVEFSGLLADWSGLSRGPTLSVTTSSPSLVHDLAGNSMIGTWSDAIDYLDLGELRNELTFGSQSEVGQWGATKWWATGADGSPCPTGTCVELGPVDMSQCGTYPKTGIAGHLLTTAPSGVVHMSVRALSSALIDTYQPDLLVVETAVSGGGSSSSRVPMPVMHDLGVTPTLFGSDPWTIDVPLSAPVPASSEVGFSATFAGWDDPACTIPALVMFDAHMTLVVDRVWMSL